jgi:hypothetical protein
MDRIFSAQHHRSLRITSPSVRETEKVHPHNTYLYVGKPVAKSKGKGRHHFSCTLSTSMVSKFRLMVSRKELSSSMTSCERQVSQFYFVTTTYHRYTNFDNFHRLFIHALGPRKFWSFLRFSRSEQNLETLFHIIHKVLSSI